MIPFLDLKGLNAQYKAELTKVSIFYIVKGKLNANN